MRKRQRRPSELDSTDSNYPSNSYPTNVELGGTSVSRGKAELGYNPVPMENIHDSNAKMRGNAISEMGGTEGRTVSEMGDEEPRVELP